MYLVCLKYIPVCAWIAKIILKILCFYFWQCEKILCVRDRYVVVFKSENSSRLHGNHTCHNVCTYWVHTSTYWYVPFSALRTGMYSVQTGTYLYVPKTMISYNRSRFQMSEAWALFASGYSRCMLSHHIHFNCTDIKPWQNFQEVIPFLLEAAAQFSDFWHRINKIKERTSSNLHSRILQLSNIECMSV
jgi:hypothetical protein